MDPSGFGGSYVFQRWTWKDSDEELLLVTSKCLICGKFLLEGRLKKLGESETSLGTLYVLTKDKFNPAPKDIPDSDLHKFYEREWEFITTLLADFNKLTIAVAVAAAVFFDKYPSVFYSFIVTCFIMIALYAAAYLGQREISRKYYRDAGKTFTPTYKSTFDTASRFLQVIFGVAIVVVLCLMVRAERNLMSKQESNDHLERTRPYNPPSSNPPVVQPKTPTSPPPQQPPATKMD